MVGPQRRRRAGDENVRTFARRAFDRYGGEGELRGWKVKTLSPLAWDFRSVKLEQLNDAIIWEYSISSPKVRAMVEHVISNRADPVFFDLCRIADGVVNLLIDRKSVV